MHKPFTQWLQVFQYEILQNQIFDLILNFVNENESVIDHLLQTKLKEDFI